VAWDREREARSAGLRTFPLVAVASCGFALVGTQLAGGGAESLARVIQGLIAGIGFIGGGAILKHGGTVEGTATAASIWNTGAIGAAVALGRYEIAVVLSAVNFLTLRLLTPLKDSIAKEGHAGRDDSDQGD
jgi:putative Mg2+ transporter-C (MgtC) family protein